MKNAVLKKEGYTSYKIAHFRKYNPTTKTLRGGTCIFALDKGNKLSIRKVSYTIPFMAGDKSRKFLTLSAKNGKMYIYSTEANPVSGVKKTRQVVIPTSFKFKLDWFWGKNVLKKSQANRLKTLIGKWAKRNGIKAAKGKDVREVVFKTIYPDLYLPAIETVDVTFSKYLRGDNLKYAVKKCFGNSGKKIVALVGQYLEKQKSYKILNLGLITKGIFPIDVVQRMIRESLDDPMETPYARERVLFLNYIAGEQKSKILEIRKLLSNYSQKRIYTLLCGDVQNKNTLYDSLRMWGNMGFVKSVLPESPKNFNEIHEHLSREQHKVNNPDYPLEVPESYIEVNNLEVDNFRFEIPKSYYSLVDYGKKMSNCIASYSGEMLRKNCVLMGIYKDSDLAYNIMIRGKKVSQFYGKHNRLPDKEDREIILGILEEKNLIFNYKEVFLSKMANPF